MHAKDIGIVLQCNGWDELRLTFSAAQCSDLSLAVSGHVNGEVRPIRIRIVAHSKAQLLVLPRDARKESPHQAGCVH